MAVPSYLDMRSHVQCLLICCAMYQGVLALHINGVPDMEVPNLDQDRLNQLMMGGEMSFKQLLEAPGLTLHPPRGQVENAKCLNFIHIPKTAGTSIEIQGFHLHQQNKSMATEWGSTPGLAVTRTIPCNDCSAQCGRHGPWGGPTFCQTCAPKGKNP